ncbi:MAG TPA: glycosyltransferase family 39 protein [Solirubrobacteraceae bacterium]|jgi:4-amino-4-deoxy-L-arabinose transferase-like glycosyltransferase|nr:glycosyltransferase family 39 protein [Solirubrobacteraceae bacterium]
MSSTVATDADPIRAPLPDPRARGSRPLLLRDPAWLLVGVLTAGAAVLRFWQLGRVPLDPFYDAAVRSMGHSWHNFFFGAFEPGGSVSIDKPPVDLWLQVISTKLFGFSATTLKLPEAAAGTLSVPLLFVTVRRVFGTAAGVLSALAIAVLPMEVLTARSDTMDAVMMLLITLGLLLVIRASETGRTRWLLLAAAALGVAFNVKLLEAVIPLPALGLVALYGLPGTWRRRGLQLAAAGAVYIAVSLSWLTATLVFPAHDRPWAIGSSDGSAWNAAFVFNGTQRVFGKAQQGDQPVRAKGSRYPTATQTERNKIPIGAGSVTRLLDDVGPMSAERLGWEVLVGVLLGVPALLLAITRRGPPWIRARAEDEARVQRATAVGLIAWLVIGIVLFSHMSRLHPRYVEAFDPAVAAMVGIGLAWVLSLPRWIGVAALAALFAILVPFGHHLEFGAVAVWWVTLLGALAVLGVLAAGAWRQVPLTHARFTSLAAVLLVVPVLAIPARTAIFDVHAHDTDAGNVGAIPQPELGQLSRFLTSHQGRARYEVVAISATKVSSLIVQDDRPVLVLTTYNSLPLLPVPRLAADVAAGQVHFAIIDSYCAPVDPSIEAACSPGALWVRAHGVDISRGIGLSRPGIIYALPGPGLAQLLPASLLRPRQRPARVPAPRTHHRAVHAASRRHHRTRSGR